MVSRPAGRLVYHILMHAMGANTAGQLGRVMVGGVLLALVLALTRLACWPGGTEFTDPCG